MTQSTEHLSELKYWWEEWTWNLVQGRKWIRKWLNPPSESGRLLGITLLVLWSRKLAPTSQPITWKPKTIATRTLVFTVPRFPWFRVKFCFFCCKRKQCPIIFSRLLQKYFDLKLKFGHYKLILFAPLLLQWFLILLQVDFAATIGKGQDPGNFCLE